MYGRLRGCYLFLWLGSLLFLFFLLVFVSLFGFVIRLFFCIVSLYLFFNFFFCSFLYFLLVFVSLFGFVIRLFFCIVSLYLFF